MAFLFTVISLFNLYPTDVYAAGTVNPHAVTPSGTEESAAEESIQAQQNNATPFTCDMWHLVPGCIGAGAFAIMTVSGYVLTATGMIFDILMAFGLDKNIMDADFVRLAWVGIRDLTNILFIFILIYVAIATILDIGKHTAKSTLHKIIIAALLINFSLFISRAIIDAGNITALFFYDAIKVNDQENLSEDVRTATKLANTSTEIKGVSSAIVSVMEPQKILKDTRLDADTDTNAWKLIFLYVASTAMLLFAAWIFFTTAFLFLSRIAILWIIMAMSPIMVAGSFLPGPLQTHAKTLWKELIGKSFCITIFMFFVWLAILFANPANSGDLFLSAGGEGLNFMEFIVVLALKFGVILTILQYGKNLTKKQCDSIGGISLDIGKKLAGAAGIAGGLALGGIGGAALRNIVGGGAMRSLNTVGTDGMTRSQRLASGNVVQRMALRGLEGAQGSSFDIRRTKAGGKAGMNKGLAAWGVKQGEGGFGGKVDRKEKYFNSLTTKLGKVDDKDPAKAAAAKAALERFVEQQDKKTGSWYVNNAIQAGSMYHDTLKRIASGNPAPAGVTLSKEDAAKNLASYEKQIASETRDTIAKGFGGSATNTGRARAAQKAMEQIEKSEKKIIEDTKKDIRQRENEVTYKNKSGEFYTKMKEHTGISVEDPLVTGKLETQKETEKRIEALAGYEKHLDEHINELNAQIKIVGEQLKKEPNNNLRQIQFNTTNKELQEYLSQKQISKELRSLGDRLHGQKNRSDNTPQPSSGDGGTKK